MRRLNTCWRPTRRRPRRTWPNATPIVFGRPSRPGGTDRFRLRRPTIWTSSFETACCRRHLGPRSDLTGGLRTTGRWRTRCPSTVARPACSTRRDLISSCLCGATTTTGESRSDGAIWPPWEVSLTPDPGTTRLRLAEEVTDPRNPLTARVIVNRVWSHLYGRGLVATVDNFGRVWQPSVPSRAARLSGGPLRTGRLVAQEADPAPDPHFDVPAEQRGVRTRHGNRSRATRLSSTCPSGVSRARSSATACWRSPENWTTS